MKRISILLLVFFTSFATAAWPQHKIITFDIPGAGTGAGQGTLPIGIVQGEWVSGSYVDASGVYHGFLRAPDGAITKFDVPGMGTGAGQGVTEVFGMTPMLEITGTYLDANNAYHAFVRSPLGRIIRFACPGAGPGGAAAEAVNPGGVISAMYLDANNAWHGCLRFPDGTFADYDPPDAGTGPGQGPYIALFSGINPQGATTGEYYDANYVWHGYVRDPYGNITEFDAPGASNGGTGTLGINAAGEIFGWYYDANITFHGYVRDSFGKITQFDVPGAGTGQYQGTNACWYTLAYGGLNSAGTVTGFYVDANNMYHGFQRTRDGRFDRFSVPGGGTGAWQGTMPISISPEGAITGWYIDANNVYHGFLRMPF
jgi:hypothetical protein